MLFPIKIVLLVYIFTLQRYVTDASSHLELNSEGDLNYAELVIKRIGDTLQLSCQLEGQTKSHNPSPFIWNFLPMDDSKNISKVLSSNDTSLVSNMTLVNLDLKHSGLYICTLPPYSVKKRVLVQPKVVKCARGGLTCGTRCIFAAYLCDGVSDCENGEDEDPTLCGLKNPCEEPYGLKCGFKRCIPKAACCGNRKNCQPHPCCDGVNHIDGNDMDYSTRTYVHHQERNNQASTEHSTLFIVAACVFMIFLSVGSIVAVICRMRWKRLEVYNTAPTFMTNSPDSDRRTRQELRHLRGGDRGLSPIIGLTTYSHPNAITEETSVNIASDAEEPEPDSFTAGPIQFPTEVVVHDQPIRGFHLNLRRFARNAVPRPDTPTVVEVELNTIERPVPTSTVVELGEEDDNTTDSACPPTYAEAVEVRFVGPPPRYVSFDDLHRPDMNGNQPMEPPPDYEDPIPNNLGPLTFRSYLR